MTFKKKNTKLCKHGYDIVMTEGSLNSPLSHCSACPREHSGKKKFNTQQCNSKRKRPEQNLLYPAAQLGILYTALF